MNGVDAELPGPDCEADAEAGDCVGVGVAPAADRPARTPGGKVFFLRFGGAARESTTSCKGEPRMTRTDKLTSPPHTHTHLQRLLSLDNSLLGHWARATHDAATPYNTHAREHDTQCQETAGSSANRSYGNATAPARERRPGLRSSFAPPSPPAVGDEPNSEAASALTGVRSGGVTTASSGAVVRLLA